jgi:hypothetical protein
MRRCVLFLVTAVAAPALACELLVSTSGFSEPDDARDAQPEASGADASPPVDAAPDTRPRTCACYREAGATYCAPTAAKHASAEGCVLDAGDSGLGDLLACTDGAWTIARACNSGCTTDQAGVDRCLCPCVAGPGDYCGFTVEDAQARYDCWVPYTVGHTQDLLTCAGDKDGGVWSNKITCPNGCMFNPSGSDLCK